MMDIPQSDQSALGARDSFYEGGDYAKIDGKEI